MTGPYHQQYPQQPAYPRQPPPVGSGGQSAIAVTTMYLWFGWVLLYLIKPRLFLNGQEVAGVWGRNVISVPPGQHHLHIHLPYHFPFGPKWLGSADLTVPVQPGEIVELEYRAPAWSLSAGSLGPPPQRYRGVGAAIAVVVGLMAVACCLLIVVAVAAG